MVDSAEPDFVVAGGSGPGSSAEVAPGAQPDSMRGGDLNLVIISVGTAVTSGSVLQSMVDTVAGSGGVGKYIAATEEDDDRALRSAFAQVEERRERPGVRVGTGPSPHKARQDLRS